MSQLEKTSSHTSGASTSLAQRLGHIRQDATASWTSNEGFLRFVATMDPSHGRLACSNSPLSKVKMDHLLEVATTSLLQTWVTNRELSMSEELTNSLKLVQSNLVASR